MWGACISLALLGLAAVDPIGIAAMPLLLVQRRPFWRSFMFLGGSFVSLMVMGLLCARGLGQRVLRFENAHTWFMPIVEAAGGVILLAVAAFVFWQAKTGHAELQPSSAMKRRLQLGDWQLFVLGALLVAVQSVVDVVFVIAMIRVGQLHLSALGLTVAVGTYAVAALVLQVAVVVAYKLAPARRKAQTLETVHRLLAKYANELVVGVSLLLGCVLLVLAAGH